MVQNKPAYYIHLKVPNFPVPILTSPLLSLLTRYKNFPSQARVLIWSLLYIESSNSVKLVWNCQLEINREVCITLSSLNEPFLSYSAILFSTAPTGSLASGVLCCRRTSSTWINRYPDSLQMISAISIQWVTWFVNYGVQCILYIKGFVHHSLHKFSKIILFQSS